MNKKRFKNIPSGIKYLILIIAIIILVIIFNVVNNSMHNEQNNPNEDIGNTPPATNSNNNNNNSNNNNNNNNPTIPNNDDTIIGSGDNIDIIQYTLYDTYVVTSNNTQYGNYGWKYFLIRSHAEFTNYIDNYFNTINNRNISMEINNLKENITSEFFKTGCVIIVVDYSLNKISGLVDNILLSDNLANISINRNIANTDSSKYVMHVLPIKSNTIRTVQIQYTK